MMEKFVYSNGIRSRVCEWGSKENPSIICIHGLGGTSFSFLELGEILKDKYHLVSIELPGHGKSESFNIDADYAIPNLVEWLNNVVEQLALGKFYILAHSWGGCIALHYGAKYPNRIKKIMLIDGGYHIKQIQYDYFKNKDKSMLGFNPICSLEDEIMHYEEDFDGYVFEDLDRFLEEEKENYLRWNVFIEEASKDLMKVDGDVIRFCASGNTARGAIKSMYDYPTSKIYDKLSMPILLLQATLPASWSEIRDIMVNDFLSCTCADVIKIEASHMLHWDKPELVVKEINVSF